MALSRSAKRPLQIMLSTRHGFSGKNYSTSTCKAVSTTISQLSDTKTPSESAFGMFFRRFSSQAPVAQEQMSLIKQLRERTSAPIKDVKAALVDCNWDIGTNGKFWFDLMVLWFFQFLNLVIVVFSFRGGTKGFEEEREGFGLEKVWPNCCWGINCIGTGWGEGCTYWA